MASEISVTVGVENADIVGRDHRALQAAVDYVGNLGGGTVSIGPGTYLMEDALHLWSDVTLQGAGPQTVLLKSPGVASMLAADGDYGDWEVQAQDPSGFRVGMGVTVGDEQSGGFHLSVATIVAKEGDSLRLNGRHQADYVMRRGAWVANAFPIVSGRHVKNVRLDGLTIEGNKGENRLLNGCRGAGIYFMRSQDIVIAGCTVRDFNGDGISFQQSADVSVLDCICQGNTALGLHPGSGSQRPVIRGCQSTDNGRIGLFFCWRVKGGIAEDNTLLRNGQSGISIGHKDTDNLIRGNTVSENGRVGILFRNERGPQGAHRNRVIENVILDNGDGQEGYGIKIEGETHDLVIEHNTIGNSPGGNPRQRIGVHIGAEARDILMEGNRFQGNAEGDLCQER